MADENLNEAGGGTPAPETPPPPPPSSGGGSAKENKILVGILAILLGGLGIHKFILGYNTEGIIMIVVSIVTCGTIGPLIGLIEGIIYLTKSDEDFIQTYVVGQKKWF